MSGVEEEKKSSYLPSHKNYYEKNKEAIRTHYKESKPYLAFYERNKEKLRHRALERYYAKKQIKNNTENIEILENRA